MTYLAFSYMYNQEYYIIKILCNLLYTRLELVLIADEKVMVLRTVKI